MVKQSFSSNRKIPSTMASQHPDHGTRPYWHTEEYINTRQETHECFLNFSELGVSECKWDWEGKLVDESVMERLLSEHLDFFKKFPLGQEKFLTFRLPNPKVETEFRLGRAFGVILAASGLAEHLGFSQPPLFEVILPMTESAQEMIAIQEAFREMASLKHRLYNFENGTIKHIEVIPLFEQVSTIIRSHRLLEEYLWLHEKKFGSKPAYIRPYVARSDPALNSGLVPAVLAIKIALWRYQELERKTGVRLYPIIGSGSLPFRGGLTPETVECFTQEYAGIKTALLQSAFRYDFETPKVIQAVRKLEDALPKGKASPISALQQREMQEIITVFESYYRQTIEKIAPLVNEMASFLPPRRERVLHVGLFGYSRGVGKVRLPRAIGFTGVLYSLGIPPELIGTGRGLKWAKNVGKLELLEKYYVNLGIDLKKAGYFLNREVLKNFSRKEKAWQEIEKDVEYIEEYLGEKIIPKTEEQKEHHELAGKIRYRLASGKSLTEMITRAAVLRRSLG